MSYLSWAGQLSSSCSERPESFKFANEVPRGQVRRRFEGNSNKQLSPELVRKVVLF